MTNSEQLKNGLPLESQVTSLETSKKLKELGVEFTPLFWWNELAIKPQLVIDSTNAYADICTPAATIAQLGELLPDGYSSWKYLKENKKIWRCAENVYDYSLGVDAETEADARAKMLIYLKENKLI